MSKVKAGFSGVSFDSLNLFHTQGTAQCRPALDIRQILILKLLLEQGSLSLTELSLQLSVSKATLERSLASLLREKTTASMNSWRFVKKQIITTPKGVEAYCALTPEGRNWATALFSH